MVIKTVKDLINPIKTFKLYYQNRDLLWQLTRRNIESKYRGSLIGVIWMFITPLLLLTIYTFVFSIIFKSKWKIDVGDSKVSFALVMLCGMAVYNVFAESISSSTSVIVQSPNLVKKVVFPLEMLPVSNVLTALFYCLVWSIILLLGILIFMNKLCFTIVLLPVILLPIFLMSCGVCWIFASLGVYFRDLQHLIGLLLQMLFFLSPIFYPVEMVPQQFRFLFDINPLTIMIQEFRDIFIFGQYPDLSMWIFNLLISLAVYQLGYFWFMKTKRGFADVI